MCLQASHLRIHVRKKVEEKGELFYSFCSRVLICTFSLRSKSSTQHKPRKSGKGHRGEKVRRVCGRPVRTPLTPTVGPPGPDLGGRELPPAEGRTKGNSNRSRTPGLERTPVPGETSHRGYRRREEGRGVCLCGRVQTLGRLPHRVQVRDVAEEPGTHLASCLHHPPRPTEAPGRTGRCGRSQPSVDTSLGGRTGVYF